MLGKVDRQIEIFLALEYPVVTAGAEQYLRSNTDVRIVGHASRLGDAVQRVRKSADVVIVDLPPIPEAVTTLCSAAPETNVIVFTSRDDEDFVLHAAQSGARGIVSKTASKEEFSKAIEAVVSGDTYFSERASKILVDEAIRERARRTVELSSREREVLREVAMGRTSKEISDRLDLSIGAVEAHRESVMDKLHIHTTARLTQYAIANGLIDP